MHYHNYNILVLAVPQLLKVPPKKVNSVEGGSATFNFQLSGVPTPTVYWYHDGVLLDASADYIDFGTDYVTVKDLIKADSGMYQLRAVSPSGVAQTSLELLVLPPGIL